MLRFSAERDAETEDPDIMDIYNRFKRFVYAKTKDFTDDLSYREDIAQETWICLMRNVGTLKRMEPKAQATYIARTVRSSALDYLSKTESRLVLTPDPSDSDQDNGFPSAEEMFFLTNAVSGYNLWKELSQEDRRLLIGRYIQGLSDRELAKLCNVKEDSIRMMMTRARRRAKEFILAEMEAQNEGK